MTKRRRRARPRLLARAAAVAILPSFGIPDAGAARLSSGDLAASRSDSRQDEPTADPSGMPARAPEATLRISSVNPTLKPGADLRVGVEISNPTDTDVYIARLTLRAQSYSMTSRSNAVNWMNGTGGSVPVWIKNADLTVKAGSNAAYEIVIPAADVPWPATASNWGARGIEVVSGGDVALEDRSIVVVEPDSELTPMPLAVVSPEVSTTDTLGEPFEDKVMRALGLNDPAEGPSGEPTEIATATPSDAPSGSADPSVTVTNGDQPTSNEPDSTATPSGSAATDSPGDGTSPSDGQSSEPYNPPDSTPLNPSPSTTRNLSLFLDYAVYPNAAITNVINVDKPAAVVVTPKYDPDYAALAHTDRGRILDDLLAELELGLSEDLPLLSVPTTIFWPVGPVDQETLDLLGKSGATGVLLPDSQIWPVDNLTFTPDALTSVEADGEQITAAAIDTQLTAAASGSLTNQYSSETITELETLDSRQVTLALSSIQYRERPYDSRTTVMAIPREGDSYYRGAAIGIDRTDTLATVEALFAAPWVSPIGIDDVLAGTPSDLERATVEEHMIGDGEMPRSDFASVEAAQRNVEVLASLTDQAELITELGRDDALSNTSYAWRSDPDKRSDNLNDLASALDLTKAIEVEASSTINMIAETASIPVHIKNGLKMPVTVVVSMDTPDSRLVSEDPVVVTLPAETTTSVSLPVRAWGSGNVDVKVNLAAADGTAIGTPSTIHVRVRADWENVGTILLGSALVIVLVFGIYKSVKKGRRSDPVKVAEFTASLREVEEKRSQEQVAPMLASEKASSTTSSGGSSGTTAGAGERAGTTSSDGVPRPGRSASAQQRPGASPTDQRKMASDKDAQAPMEKP